MLEVPGMQVHLLPSQLADSQWGVLGWAQGYLWLWVLSVIVFAFSIATAHAVISSLVLTRHAPPAAARLKLPLTVVGLIGLVLALFFIYMAFARAYEAIETFYPRVWI